MRFKVYSMNKLQRYIVNDENFHKEIGPNIWLMDDHKWAFWAWINFATTMKFKLPLSLYHVDYHWDAINDFQSDAALADMSKTDMKDLYQLVSDDFIKKDGFIAPAIIKGIFDEVHFYCRQNDTQIGFINDFIEQYYTKQYIHKTILIISDLGE